MEYKYSSVNVENEPGVKMDRIYQVVTDDVNIEGTFTTIYEASKLKQMLDQCPDEYILPAEIKEIRFTNLEEFQLRTYIIGTINIATGQIGQLLESKRVTTFKGEYEKYMNLDYMNLDYIEIHYYGNMVMAVERLKKLREEHING